MVILGSIIFGIGFLLWLGGEVRLLAIAYRRSLLWFLGCLFIPFVSWIFFLLNARQTWKPVVVATAGFVVAGFGYWAGGLEFLQ